MGGSRVETNGDDRARSGIRTGMQRRRLGPVVVGTCLLGVALGVAASAYWRTGSTTTELDMLAFRAKDWDLLNARGDVIAGLMNMRPDGSALGLDGWYRNNPDGSVRVMFREPSRAVVFKDVWLRGPRIWIEGEDAEGKSLALRERVSGLRFVLYGLAAAMTFGGVLLLLRGRVLSIPEVLGLSGMAFGSFLMYGRYFMSAHVNSSHGELAWWMRSTAYRHVANGLGYTKGLDVASDLPERLSLGYLGGHHPPGLGLLLAGVYWVTGASPHDVLWVWVVPLFFHALGAAAFYLLLRSVWGPLWSQFALGVYLFLPMSVYFGRVACHESPTMGLSMVGLWLSVCFLRHGGRARLATALGSLGAACLAGWPAYFYCAAAGVGALLLFDAPKRRRFMLFASVGAVSACVLALVFLQQQVFLGSIDALIHAADRRVGAGGLTEFGVAPYTWGEWLSTVASMAAFRTYGIPLIALSVVGAVFVVARWRRGAADDVTWLFGVTSAVAVMHIVIFHFGSYVHDYWTFYCIPPVAIAIAYIPQELFRAPRARAACALALAVVTLASSLYLLPKLGAL